MSERFSTEELQTLERFLDSGIFLSAEKLAALSGTTWEIVSSSVQELPVVKVISLFNQDQESCYGVHMEARDTLPVHVLVFFKEPSAWRLTEAVVSRSDGMRVVQDPVRVVIPEIYNKIGRAHV